MTEKPNASSTPKLVNIEHRPSIRDLNKDYLRSPIIPLDDYDEKSASSDDETDDIENELVNTQFVCGFSFTTEQQEVAKKELSLQDLTRKFPSQVEDFWLSVEVNVKEILQFNHPKSFLFLYNGKSQKTTDNIIYGISNYAVCKLTNCSTVPVMFHGYELNTPSILNDYGTFIDAVKNKLEASGVMIVKNLEDVPGRSAQAFHSLCDEYNPVVNKALFIFTMKVNDFDKNNFNLVEKYLRNLWSDIKDDLFHPLLTRISYNILRIVAEPLDEV